MKPEANNTAPVAPQAEPAFMRFLFIFHAFFIGGLAVTWGITAFYGHFSAGKLMALTALVLVQITLYLKTFARASEASKGWWAGYVVSGLCIWQLEVALTSDFQWVILAYAGQFMGALRPRVSLPVVLLALGIYLFTHQDLWLGHRINLPFLLAISLNLIAFSAICLFIHHLAKTNTERAQLIQKLESANREIAAAQERELELVVVKERERLARELHDNLGHVLAVLAVQLEAAQRLLKVDPVQADAHLQELKALVRQSMGDLRCALADLRSKRLGDRRLTEAVPVLVEEAAKRTKRQITHRCEAAINDLPAPLTEVIWQVICEGIVNIERHSRAQNATVIARIEGKTLEVILADDGVGFSPQPEHKSGHYGLKGIRERVEGVGGTVEFGENTPHGARIVVKVPLMG